jgi:hypothetical protein
VNHQQPRQDHSKDHPETFSRTVRKEVYTSKNTTKTQNQYPVQKRLYKETTVQTLNKKNTIDKFLFIRKVSKNKKEIKTKTQLINYPTKESMS